MALEFFEHAKSLARAREEIRETPHALSARHVGYLHQPIIVCVQPTVLDGDSGRYVEDDRRSPLVRYHCQCGWTPSQADDHACDAEARYMREHFGIVFPSVTDAVVDSIDFSANGVAAGGADVSEAI
jgi:hypothetical protein